MEEEDFSDDDKIRFDWEVTVDDDGVTLNFQCPIDTGYYGCEDRIGGYLSFSDFANDDFGFSCCQNFDDACKFFIKELEKSTVNHMEGYMPDNESWWKEDGYKEAVKTVEKELRSSHAFQKMWVNYKLNQVSRLARKEASLRGVIMKFLGSEGRRLLFSDGLYLEDIPEAQDWHAEVEQDSLDFYRRLSSLFNSAGAIDKERIEDMEDVSLLDFDDFYTIGRAVFDLQRRKCSSLCIEKNPSLQWKIPELEMLDRNIIQIHRGRDSKSLLISSDYDLIYSVVFEEEKETLSFLCEMLESI